MVIELRMSLSDARLVFRMTKEERAEPQQAVSAHTLLQQTSEAKTISTMAMHVDSLLDGGVPLGQITEICTVLRDERT